LSSRFGFEAPPIEIKVQILLKTPRVVNADEKRSEGGILKKKSGGRLKF
jgi:hypothetical protein